jgi:hypothetical protein
VGDYRRFSVCEPHGAFAAILEEKTQRPGIARSLLRLGPESVPEALMAVDVERKAPDVIRVASFCCMNALGISAAFRSLVAQFATTHSVRKILVDADRSDCAYVDALLAVGFAVLGVVPDFYAAGSPRVILGCDFDALMAEGE